MFRNDAWQPMPLVLIKGADSTVRLAGVASNGAGPHISAPQATVLGGTNTRLQGSLGGQTSLPSQLTLGQPERVTGCSDSP